MQDLIQIDRKRALELIEKCAKYFAERKLGAAAILTIESLKPLNFIGGQLLYAASPFAEVFFKAEDIQEVASLMENREYIDLLIKRIDELDEELHKVEREKRRLIREGKRKKKRLKNS